MRDILITGGGGFIGKHAQKYLAGKGYKVEVPSSEELNVLKQNDWEQWKRKEIRHVVHLAGKTFVPDSWVNPEDFFQANVMGTLQAIRFCREIRIGMTYVSAYVYGQPKYIPISETTEVRPNNPYAKSKYMAEELCELFSGDFGMDITVLRLFNVYGSGQKDNFLIPCIVKQALNEEDVITVQDEEPKRDFIHVDDVCRAIELSIQNTDGFHVFNVGSGMSYSVREVIDKVLEVTHTDKRICSNKNIRKNELDDVVADIGKIEREWGWKPQITLETGIHQCVEEMK